MKRVQFTVDLLPSDILGINSYNPDKHTFLFILLLPSLKSLM
ncbi:MAG: AAA family ATPase [Candidatus Omnitrophica bacterium]|nr:AAA family ATPase [Candidatus Omnitrophota bacterium]